MPQNYTAIEARGFPNPMMPREGAAYRLSGRVQGEEWSEQHRHGHGSDAHHGIHRSLGKERA